MNTFYQKAETMLFSVCYKYDFETASINHDINFSLSVLSIRQNILNNEVILSIKKYLYTVFRIISKITKV